MATLKDLNRLVDLGFDNSSLAHRADKNGYRPLHVSCSQCEALAINGMVTHEVGCINMVSECRGCNEIIPHGQRYCADCRS